jgi:hypothetical protein
MPFPKYADRQRSQQDLEGVATRAAAEAFESSSECRGLGADLARLIILEHVAVMRSQPPAEKKEQEALERRVFGAAFVDAAQRYGLLRARLDAETAEIEKERLNSLRSGMPADVVEKRAREQIRDSLIEYHRAHE